LVPSHASTDDEVPPVSNNRARVYLAGKDPTVRSAISAVICPCAAVLLLVPALARGAGDKEELPPFSEIEKAVRQHFATQPGYSEGGIIVRSEVAELFGTLKGLGWAVAGANDILSQVPKDGEFLTQQLRTKAGAKFARQIARLPEGFDRLEKLSRIPNGRQTIRDLIKGPDGYKLIEYMTTTSGGEQMGRMLSQTPNGRKFNKPTGRIYTVEMLLERLKQEHAAAVQGAAAPAKA